MRLVIIAGLIMGVSLSVQGSFGARGAALAAAGAGALPVRSVWFFNANRGRTNATIGGFASEQDCQFGADLLRQRGEAAIRSACFERPGIVTIDMPID